jgi:hypothetical protein
MPDSDIVCSGLIATSGVGQVVLAWAVSDPNQAGLPYLTLGTVEVWAASANNRTGAAKVGEALSGLTHAGVPPGETRFYWVRPRNASGLYGDWFPLSATAGVAATAGTAQPGPGTITDIELADSAITAPKIADFAVTNAKIANAAIDNAKIANAAIASANIQDAAITTAKIANATITDAKIASLSANKISASSLSAITAVLGSVYAGFITGTTIQGGVFQTAGAGRRVEISESTNAITVFNSGGSIVGRLGQTISDEIVLRIDASSSAAGASISNSGSGTALTLTSSFSQALVAGCSSSGPTGSFQQTGSGAAVHGHHIAGSGVGVFGQSGLWRGEVGKPSYAFYALYGPYGPFTGAHDALISKLALVEPGDIVVDVTIIARQGVSDTLSEVAPSHERGQRAALGAVAGRYPLLLSDSMAAIDGEITDALVDRFDRLTVNSLGEGQINVCGRGGNLDAGDLIWCSDVPGKGERQPDDLVRSTTVAKAREPVTFDHPDQVRLVACIYLAG